VSVGRVRASLAELIEYGAIPPFVYCYPVRSSYRPPDPSWAIGDVWERDLSNSLTRDLNIYIHVPFCNYKCGFCNLYTVIARGGDIFAKYTSAVCQQLDQSKSIIEARNLRTIFIGGGTPSLLPLASFESIFNKFSEIYPNWRSVVEEVCVEATPDSIVDSSRPGFVDDLVRLGVSRINMGVQSLKHAELREAGRALANEDVIRKAVAIVKESRLANLSTDLIMGFYGQTDASWQESVDELIDLQPDTISTYFLTVRPDAWFSKTGRYVYQRDPALYARYDYARSKMRDAGYIQESNVRYKIPGKGGYRQKVLQFRGVPVLGIGAGARTYTNTADYIVGGGIRGELEQIWEYIGSIETGCVPVKGAYEFNDEERIRKRLVLDLFDLDLAELEPYHVRDYGWIYDDLIQAAIEENLLVKIGASRLQLTSRGYKYRDILSWMFFSDTVRARDAEFYRLLHARNERATVGMGDPAVMAAG
jgi:oxygen-independent coproporphyrinogen-3 oxidase